MGVEQLCKSEAAFPYFTPAEAKTEGSLVSWSRLGSHFTVKQGMQFIFSNFQYFSLIIHCLSKYILHFKITFSQKYNNAAIVKKRDMQLCRQMPFISGSNVRFTIWRKDNVQTSIQIILLIIHILVAPW